MDMYGLNPETDLSPLNGCTLTFVGFGEYQVQMGFSGDVQCAISIEGDYVVAPSGREPTRFDNALSGAAPLLHLLGQTVAHASVPVDGTLRIGFADGSEVEVLDSSAHYESYTINLGNRLFVV